MKRIIPLLSLLMCILLSGVAWGANWYVDGWDGDDSHSGTNMSTDAFETIKRALDRCSNGDTIYLKGEFLEAPRDTNYTGGANWDGNRLAQIFIDKSNITMTRNSGEPFIPVIYGYSPDDSLDYVVRVDNTGNTLEDIEFDGYDSWQSNGDVETHNNIYMTPDADNTDIKNCDFENFGNEWAISPEYYFYSIIGGGWPQSSSVNELQNVEITDNDFTDNTFESKGAHEIYLSEASSVTVSGNDITSNGAGNPLKLRDGCNNITFNNNTVYGAHGCFLVDDPNSGEDASSNIVVTNNTFTDPNSVIDTDYYRGPFWPESYHAYITEFSGNTIVEGGDRTWEVKGITSNGSSLFMAYKNSTDNHFVAFREHNGPIFKRTVPYLAYNFVCDGNMSHITSASDTTVIVSSRYNNTIRVYKLTPNSATRDSFPDLSTASYDITAMCPFNSTYSITAVKEKVSGVWYTRIYKSTVDSLKSYKMYDQPATTVSSVTAVAVTGNTLIFGTHEGGSSYKIYSGTIPTSGYISTTQRESLSYEVTGLTYKSSTLMTALQDGTSTKIYSGTTSDPVGTLRETYTTTNLIALESDSEFIFMVKDNTGDDDEERTVYFTDSTTNMDKDIIYHSKWYTGRY